MSLPSIRRPQSVSAAREGWHGWDDYAQFYDWRVHKQYNVGTLDFGSDWPIGLVAR